MKDRCRRGSLLVMAILIYAGVIGIAYIYAPSNWLALQTWAVVITGIVLIWYTWETRELRVASYVQIESQIRPYVLLKRKNDGFLVTNFGNGVALHVRIDPVIVNQENQMEIRFPKAVAVLSCGESAPIEAKSYMAGKEDVENGLDANLDPKFATQELPVTIHFDNIELKSYTITQHFSRGRVQVAAVNRESNYLNSTRKDQP